MKQVATCITCNGPISRRVKPGTENWPVPEWAPWLHLLSASWTQEPHNATPADWADVEEIPGR